MPKTYGLNKSKHFSQSYHTDCLMGEDQYGYHINADYDHDLKKWIVYAEDHEPSELAKQYPDTYQENGFNTLKDASIFIWEFVNDYYTCWEDNKEEDKQTMATMTLKKAQTLALAKGISLYKEGSYFWVEFENGKLYKYRDTLTNVCQRLGLINADTVDQLRGSDSRYLQNIED